MHFIYRAFHPFPSPPLCTKLSCLSEVLDTGVIKSVPVYDDVGVAYAMDLEVQQGFYLLILAYIFLRYVRRGIILAYIARKGKGKGEDKGDE